jgi:hypothetical protein
MDSYFNMCLTNSHHLSLTEEVYAQFKATWETMMLNEARMWSKFNKWWLSSGIPLFVLRYEDLRETPDKTLAALIKWIDFPEGEADVVGPDSEPKPPVDGGVGVPYTPRVGAVGKSLRRFESQLLDDVIAASGPMLLSNFGYHPKSVADGGNGFPASQRRPDYEGGRCTKPRVQGRTHVVLSEPASNEVRPDNDQFGRYMTVFRKLHTADDTEPLAVVSGEPYRLPPRLPTPSLLTPSGAADEFAAV